MRRSEEEIGITVARRVTTVTLGAVAWSVLLTLLIRIFFGDALNGMVPSIAVAALVPAIIAPLGSWRLISLTERLRIANEHLRTLSETDPLTRALNRRRFLEVFQQHLALARRHGYPTSVLLIDFDHFKHINDRFGHGIGDQVLVESSALIRSLCRTTDAFARFGGEEFVLLLPHTDRAGAEEVARRILQRVRGLVVHDPASGLPLSLSVTVSIGGATSAASEDAPEAMFARADTLLYAAKQAGRDRCVFENVPERPAPRVAATGGR